MRCSSVLALLLSVAACGGASPTAPDAAAARSVYYVSPGGSDQNDGSMEAPLQTIRSAVARLRPGNTLYLRGGVYTGAANTIDSQAGIVPAGTSWDNPIIIAGIPGEPVTLRPPPNVSGIRLTSAAARYLIFQDFTIDMGASGPGADADGIYVDTAHHNRFQRIEVMNSYNFGVHFGVNTPFNEVLDSRIHDNGHAGGAVTNGHGLYITGSNNLFLNNEVYDNQGYGFHVYNNAGSRADPSRNLLRGNRVWGNGRHGGTAYGILVAWGDANRIESNTVFGNPGGIQVYTNSSNTEVSNNTVYGNAPLEGIVIQYANGTTVRSNNVFGNSSNIVDYGNSTQFSQNSVAAERRLVTPQP